MSWLNGCALAAVSSWFFLVATVTLDARSLVEVAPEAAKSVVYISIQYIDTKASSTSKTKSGSGVLISADGAILTAYHVVKEWVQQSEDEREAHPIIVRVGHRYADPIEALVLAQNPDTDIAVLRALKPIKYPFSSICYVTQLNAGESIYGFGFPNQSGFTPLTGTFSNVRSDYMWEAAIPIDKGMSGGAIFNTTGVVVGITHGGFEESTKSIVPTYRAKAEIESKTPVKENCESSPRTNVSSTLSGTFVGVVKGISEGGQPKGFTLVVTFNQGSNRHVVMRLIRGQVDHQLALLGNLSDKRLSGKMFPADWLPYINSTNLGNIREGFCKTITQQPGMSGYSYYAYTQPRYDPYQRSPSGNGGVSTSAECTEWTPDEVTVELESPDVVVWKQHDPHSQYQGRLHRE